MVIRWDIAYDLLNFPAMILCHMTHAHVHMISIILYESSLLWTYVEVEDVYVSMYYRIWRRLLMRENCDELGLGKF